LIDEARTPLIISGTVAHDKNFFLDVKPHVAKLVHLQGQMVSGILAEIRQMINEGDTESVNLGKALLKVNRAAPKNKSLSKILKESGMKKLLQDMEGVYIRDKKMHELDAELYFVVDEKSNAVDINEKGRDLLSNYEENLFLLKSLDEEIYELEQREDLSLEEIEKQKRELTQYFMDKNEKLHNVTQLLKAYTLFEQDVDYIIQDNKIVIVDEFTGRAMPGRRFSEGLHQALEAKENLKIESATQTLATITLQNYFRKFEKLAGMTGTAITEETEFAEIYNLKCMQMPTNLPITRIDHEDVIYMSKNEKYKAIIDEIEYWHNLQKPVLVGTVSVDVSETLSRMLKRRKINHNVLNAKYHEKEAEIIMNAGQPGSVVIATNMAGRGTDIKLGEGVISKAKESYRNIAGKPTNDNPFGLPLDGLHVIGSERHDSRRIDRQLRGRAGRQGDPGTSRFYLSLEDDLMRLFGSDRIAPMMQKLGVKEDEPIMHPWMTKAVERAQQKVEEHNFEIRKQLLKYDEIMNQQREVIYQYRRNVLKGLNLKTEIVEMIKDTIWRKVEEMASVSQYVEDWDLNKFRVHLNQEYAINLQESDFVSERLTPETVHSIAEELIEAAYENREKNLGEEKMREIERRSLLEIVDSEWRDHLHEMDHLRDGIGLRAYAQKDPLIEYKKESFELFQSLIERLQERVTKNVFTLQLYTVEEYRNLMANIRTEHKDMNVFEQAKNPEQKPQEMDEQPKLQPIRNDVEIGRNEPCPCGSGKKYKQCCGKNRGFEE
jgi:preprotein translocase subunit SecA